MTTCPQLVYTSASRTLEGPGFGVVLMSAEWPRALGNSRSTLGSLIGFDGECFGLLHRSSGRLAYRKVAASSDGFGRPGNYVVHLLWDKGGRLAPRDVLAFSRAGGFVDGVPAEPSREAPAVSVPTARRSAPALTADDVDELVPPLARVLAALSEGGVVRLPARTASGCDVAAVLFDVLPRGLAAGVSLHIGTAATMGDVAGVTVLVTDSPDSAAADAQNTARSRALLEAAAKKELCADGVRRFGDLDTWLFVDAWMALDAASLTDAQLVAVLDSEGAGRWLESPRNVDVVTAVAADVPEVEAALQSALAHFPEAWDRLRDRELTAALSAIFSGAAAPSSAVTGLTERELCEAFIAELARGRRVLTVGPAAALFVAEALGLGYSLTLLELTDDHAGLARLVTRQPAVQQALLREWVASGASAAGCTSLFGHLLLEDTDWFLMLAASAPPSVARTALMWAATRLESTQVEQLAVTVASSDLAGQGWALRDVLFPSGLPDTEIAAILGRHFEELTDDDGWPREIASLMALKLTATPAGVPADTPGDGRHRKPGWSLMGSKARRR